METLTGPEVAEIARRMVGTEWSWNASGLDAYLAGLGLRRHGDLAEISLLSLRSDRMPGQAGLVSALSSGDVMSVSASLSEIGEADDEADQVLLDRVTADARDALVQLLGRPSRRNAPVWKLDDRELKLRRLRTVVILTFVHLPNEATFNGG